MATAQPQKQRFRHVGVLGSGVMGSGIAAHLANAGLEVLLLDIPSDTGHNPNQLAQNGLNKAISSKPAAFFSPALARRVQIGNLRDDLKKLSSCDLVIEAVLEDLEIKKRLFAKLEDALSPHTIVASNTSGLSLAKMMEGRSADFQSRFLVAHFFNPARYLHLLELVAGKYTRPDVLERMAHFGEHVLGKGIVYGKDTPNFVANRVGMFGIMETIRLMMKHDFSIDEIDAIFGPALGRPKSAVFRTADIVGLDTFAHVANNCFESLQNDEQRHIFQVPDFLKKMIQNGWLGQKSGQGFYRKTGDTIEVLDWKTLTYRQKKSVRFDSLGAARQVDDLSERIRIITQNQDKAGQLAFELLSSTAIYSAFCIPEIADDILQIDRAMQWGFGFEKGPFETWEAMGLKQSIERIGKTKSIPVWVQKMLSSGKEHFYIIKDQKQYFYDGQKTNDYALFPKQDGLPSFNILKQQPSRIVKDTIATTLVDLGDGILACAFHTKMNAIDPDMVSDINHALDICENGNFDALVLANDAPNFSVGANLLLLYMAAQGEQWNDINAMVQGLQQLVCRLRYSSIPTVSAPFQMTLGGGAELAMWCNYSCAHAELYMGLVELGVGLIPAGGGTTEMLCRSLAGAVDDPNFVMDPLIRRGLETIAMAKVSTSADEAKELLYLRPEDTVCLHRSHLLQSAKQQALAMLQSGFRPPLPRQIRLPGKSLYATFEMVLSSLRDGHQLSNHDLTIALKLAHVMTGGDASSRVPMTEQQLLDLEREAFLSLCGEPKTQERIAYMLQNNKPLRN